MVIKKDLDKIITLLENSKKTKPVECPYLPSKVFVQRYFVHNSLSEYEFEYLLSQGWRKFGYYFFKPECPECFECTPIRVLTEEYSPAKSQRRVLGKNNATEIYITESSFSEERYEIFKKHSEIRFNQKATKENFEYNFCISAVPSFIMEYKIEEKLFGTGYIDSSSKGLSSVYFAFDPDFSYLSPGILGCIVEIHTARKFGKKYYYLGYYIKNNKTMEYKIKFPPYEHYNWLEKKWEKHALDREGMLPNKI
ncbi:MAG: arginyltransferase [Spirochaetaceae bacterium]|nr:arginyltransferase [Spirochaetaceae bacterium]